jgi:CDGSH-type Zn-finger protein
MAGTFAFSTLFLLLSTSCFQIKCKQLGLVQDFRYTVNATSGMAKTKITVNSNGSLRVEGDFEMVDKNGNPYGLGGRELVSLCRCGLSNNKPFCDGSHKGHLEHEAVAFDLPPKK